MIEFFRSFSQSWVARGFFLLLALLFLVMWGGGDWSHQLFSRKQSVATVGKEPIAAWDFFKELNRAMRQIHLSTGQPIDEEKARAMGLFEMIREKLISQKLIELETARLGIHVRDEEISALIKADKIFQDEKGVFQKTRFDAIMKNIGYDEASYVAALRNDLLKSRLVDALTFSTRAPLSATLPLYTWQQEKRSITAVLLSTEGITLNKQGTEDELKKFYEEQKSTLVAPEYRDVSLLIIDQQPLMDALMIAKSDTEAAYHHRDEEFKGKTFEQVKAQVQKDLKRQRTLEAFEKLINQVEDLLGQGKSLEEISKDLSLPLKKYKRVGQQGQNDPFVSNGLQTDEDDRKAIQEAFTLELEGQSPPVESSQGHYCVIRIDAVYPSQTRTFEEVKLKLKDFWATSKKLEALKAKASTIANDINKGVLITTLASQYKLKPIHGKIDRRGTTALSALALSQPIIERLYTLSVGEAIAVPYQVSDKKGEYAVIQVTQKESPSPQNNKEKIAEFRHALTKMFVDDILSSYIYSLRKRFPVDVNHGFLAKVTKQ